jgi:hypothetical protein
MQSTSLAVTQLTSMARARAVVGGDCESGLESRIVPVGMKPAVPLTARQAADRLLFGEKGRLKMTILRPFQR